jgi:short-subunit dehydrogenase
MRRFSFKDKVVAITGGTRGLGILLARGFGKKGAKLSVCARDPAEVARAVADLEARGLTVFGQAADVGKREQAEAWLSATEENLGPVEVLVHNAGVIQVGPYEEMRISDFEEAMRIHFFGALYTAYAVLPGMRSRGRGRIVNISSFGGKVSVPHMLPYSASKFALTGFSEGLRAELAKHHIAVTTVCPWLMRTGSAQNAFFKGNHRAEYTWFALGGALPVLSMRAERAASRIIRACERGQPEVIPTPQGRLLVAFEGLFPSLLHRMLSVVNRVLPAPGGIGQARKRGHESETRLTRSVLTRSSQRAAARTLEAPAPNPL